MPKPWVSGGERMAGGFHEKNGYVLGEPVFFCTEDGLPSPLPDLEEEELRCSPTSSRLAAGCQDSDLTLTAAARGGRKGEAARLRLRVPAAGPEGGRGRRDVCEDDR